MRLLVQTLLLCLISCHAEDERDTWHQSRHPSLASLRSVLQQHSQAPQCVSPDGLGSALFVDDPVDSEGTGRSVGRFFLDAGSQRTLSHMMSDLNELNVHFLLKRLFQGCRSALRLPRAAPGALYVDVGANVGYYGLLAAAHGCNVVMLEPQPACVDQLHRNLCLNAHIPALRRVNIDVVPYAAVDKGGTNLSMMAYPLCEQVFSIHHDSAVKATSGDARPTAAGEGGARSPISVPTIALDDLLSLPHAPLVHVAKVDVEGAEAGVLAGMQRLLAARRVRHLIMEVSPAIYQRDGLNRTLVYTMLQPLLRAGCAFHRKFPSQFKWEVPTMSEAEAEHFLVHEQFQQQDLWVDCSLVTAEPNT